MNVKTVREFLDSLDAARSAMPRQAEGSAYYYRGQADSWPLVPGLYRIEPRRKDSIIVLERDLITFWTRQGVAFEGFMEVLPHRHRLIWALMRHHGLPTRLLDWSRNPLFALYFAVREQTPPGGQPVVWVLNPRTVNLENKKPDGKLWKTDDYVPWNFINSANRPTKPIAFQSDMGVSRLIAQNGRFTSHGTDPRPLEGLVPVALQRINVSAEARLDVLGELRELGITETTIFPDLDALSKELVLLLTKPKEVRAAVQVLPLPSSVAPN